MDIQNKNFITRWMFTPAKWWAFWMPQSFIVGGLIGGCILGVLLILIALIF